MKSARIALTLVIALLIASPLMADGPKKEKKATDKCPAASRIDPMLKGLSLTDEQKTKIGEIKKEYSPKLAEAAKKMEVLTPDQKQARENAVKAAKDAGKKGKEVGEAARAAVTLTDEQKATRKAAGKDMKALAKEMTDKVMAVLTDDQKAELAKKRAEMKKKWEGKKGPGKKGHGDKKDAAPATAAPAATK